MKKTLSVFIIVIFSLMSFQISFAEAGVGDINYETAVSLGAFMPSSQIINAVFSTVNGKDYMFGTVSGDPAIFNVYNLDDNLLVDSFELTGGTTSWKHIAAANGFVYALGKNKLFGYNTETREFFNYGTICAGELDTFDMTYDGGDNLYIATIGTCRVVKFNIQTETFTDLGEIMANGYYLRCITYMDGILYCGVKTDGYVGIYTMDLSTNISAELEIPQERLYVRDGYELEWVYSCNNVGKFVVFYCKSLPNVLLVYDTVNKTFIDTGFNLSYKGLYSSPVRNGKSYFLAGTLLYYINAETGRVANTGFRVDSADTFHSVGWMTVEGDGDFPGESLVGVISATGQPFYYNVNSKIRKTMDIALSCDHYRIQSLEAGDYKNGDNGIYVGPYAGSVGARYDYETGEITTFTTDQPEDMVAYNGKMYLGTYTRAYLREYDPAASPSNTNPKLLAQIGIDQDRPYALTAGDNKIFAGTIPLYGLLGGSIGIYDLNTSQMTSYDNVIENQSIISLAYKDGLLYGGTSIYGGLSSVPKADKAKIFIFDTNTGRVLKEVTPSVPGAGNPTWFGQLAFDKNGKLWCATGSELFSLNQETLEVIDVISFGDYDYSADSFRWRPLYIKFDGAGRMYVNINGLQVVDVNTLETRNLYRSKVHEYDLDKYGNIYFAALNETYILRVDDIYLSIEEKSGETLLNYSGYVSDIDFVSGDGTEESLSLSSNPINITGLVESADNVYSIVASGGGKTKVLSTGGDFAGGCGTNDSPYLVATKEQFEKINGYPSAYFKQIADIDEAVTSPIKGIYDSSSGKYSGFDGYYNGNGHSVEVNISQSSSSDPAGLFSIITGGGTIKNLTVNGSVTGNTNVGGIAGASSGTNSSSAISGCVNNAEIQGIRNVGGILGYSAVAATDYFGKGTTLITGCVNNGIVGNNKTSYAGGICGISNSGIEKSSNSGAVTASYGAGGISSFAYGAISGCFNTGKVSSNNIAGGVSALVRSSAAKITGCYNIGEIVCKNATGITSSSSHTNSVAVIENCYNAGRIVRADNAEPVYQRNSTAAEGYSDSFTNVYYLTASGYDDGLPETTGIETLSALKALVMSGFETNENGLYKYPVISANPQTTYADFVKMNISAGDRGVSSPSKPEFVLKGSDYNITFTPEETYYASVYIDGNLTVEFSDKACTLTVNTDSDKWIKGVFSASDIINPGELEAPSYSVSEIHLSSPGLVNSSNGYYLAVPGEYIGIAAAAELFPGWELVEYGIIANGKEYPGAELSDEYKYGVLLKYTQGSSVNINSYAKYSNGEKNITVIK